MAKEEKSISKSIRFSNRTYTLIDSYEGKNFSDKLENIISVFYELKMLQTDVAELQKKKEDLDKNIYSLRRTKGAYTRIVKETEDWLNSINETLNEQE